MAKFKLQPGEQLLMEGSVPYLKSKLKYIAGSAYLTDQRFVHTSNLRAQAVGGLAGALMSGRIDLEVRLDAIERISKSSHGRKHEPVLVLDTVDGGEHRMVAPFEEWCAAFGHALMTHRATRLVELAPGEWTALRDA